MGRSSNAAFTDGDPGSGQSELQRSRATRRRPRRSCSKTAAHPLRADRDVLVYGDHADLIADHATVNRRHAVVVGVSREMSESSCRNDDATETLDLPVEYADATLLEGNYDCDDTDPGTVTLAPYEARVYELFDEHVLPRLLPA